MKFSKLVVFIFSFSIHFSALFGQDSVKVEYFQEPVFTARDTNSLIVKKRISSENFLFHWIICKDGVSYLFQSSGNEAWVHFCPPESTTMPLEHGIKYQYYFEEKDGPDTSYNTIATSPIVCSTQDALPPNIKDSSFVQEPKDGWFNKWTFQIIATIEDPAGIHSAFLFKRIKGQPWPTTPESTIPHYQEAIDGEPHDILVTDTFTVEVLEDNHYEFYIGAKDAAHDSLSCAKKWILNGNKIVPDSSSEPHLWIKIDTTEPLSDIQDLKPFQNMLDFKIHYTAHDPLAGSNNIASCLDSVSLFYIFNENTFFVDKHSFQEAPPCSVGNFFEIEVKHGEGYYNFFTRAVDHATNTESEIELVRILVDTTRPQINSFFLFDTTTIPTESYTFADTGWTKWETVWAYVDTFDNLSGVDSIFFHGDIVPVSVESTFSSPFSLKLSDGEVSKTVYCKISDKTGNLTQDTSFTIIWDSTRPQLKSLKLCDFDTENCDSTNTLMIRVIPEVDDPTDTTISHIVLFEDSEISPDTRDSLWKPYSPGVTLIYEFKDDERFAPITLCLKAVIRDYAGNVSNLVTGCIEYVPELTIRELILEDKDGALINQKGKTFTNSLIVMAKILGISRSPGVDAYFEFSKDTNFTKVITKKYDESDTITISSRETELDLSELDYDETNGKKNVCVRLVGKAIAETSNVVCHTIILDTIPPIFKEHVLTLLDKTKEDIVPDSFKADPGWTNCFDIWAEISDFPEDSSGCDSLFFWGDVNSLIAPCKVTPERISLTLSSIKENPKVKVSARDLVGNWGHLTEPMSIDSASINFDNDSPSVEIDWPDFVEVLKTDTLYVPLRIMDDPLKNLSRVFLKQVGYEWHEHSIPDSQKIKRSLPIVADIDPIPICAIAVDKAGNSSRIDTCIVISEPFLIIYLQLSDQIDITDFQYTNNDIVRVIIDVDPRGEMADSLMLSQTRNFESCRWLPFPPNGETTFKFDSSEHGDGEYRLYAKCKNNEFNVLSNTDSAFIIIDKTSPIVQSVIIKDKTDKESRSTDSHDVIVDVDGYDPSPGKLKLVVIYNDESRNEYPWSLDAEYDFWLPNGEGVKIVYAKLIDHAENESTLRSDSISYYTEKFYNVPNPFKPSETRFTNLIVMDNGKSDIEIKIYDVFGNLVITLTEKNNREGCCEIPWDGRNGEGYPVAEGAYIAVLRVGGEIVERTKIGVIRR